MDMKKGAGLVGLRRKKTPTDLLPHYLKGLNTSLQKL